MDIYLLELWYDLAGVPIKPIKPRPSLEILKRTQWDSEFESIMRKYCEKLYLDEFINYMRNRLIMGSFRYGLMEEQDYSKYDLLGTAKSKVGKYENTKNLEFLVDAANNVLLEFVRLKRLNANALVLHLFIFIRRIHFGYVSGKNMGHTLNASDDQDHAKEIS